MLDYMVFDGKLVDRANLGMIDHLLRVAGRDPSLVPISIKKGFQVLVQVLMKLLHSLTLHLLVGIFPESHLKIPLRLHFLGYFSNPFHCGVIRCNSVVCFFTLLYLRQKSHLDLSTSTCLVVYVPPWGEVYPFISLRQTDLAGFKIEGRAVVHIGIRDSIVHVESRKTALTAIVSVATTNTKAKTRNSSKGYHPAYRKACRKITK